MRIIARLFNLISKKKHYSNYNVKRTSIITETIPDVVYAVGDIHGCYEQLVQLLNNIKTDAKNFSGLKILIFLGDYVDRGPKSAAVLDFLLKQPEAGFQCICLAGNHEVAMLDFLKKPYLNHPWLKHGGLETLQSYGIREFPKSRTKLKTVITSYIPNEHIDFLNTLPLLFYYPGFCFVHAGIKDGVPFNKQKEATLLRARMPISSEGYNRSFILVHGHTIVERVLISKNCINVDTGAYKSGILSAIKITPDSIIQVFQNSIETL